MNALRSPKNGFPGSRIIPRIFEALGINPNQYRVLVDLFHMLSNRLEFMNITAGLNKIAGFCFGFSVLFSLIVFIDPPLRVYLLLILVFSMFQMLMILFQDAAQSLMNPDEASSLAHQPIGGATYVSAKLTHILRVVAIIVPSLNLIPALAGLLLHDARWFYPLSHLMAAFLAGLFVAFFVCGIFGWLFRYISPSNLKSAVLWFQLVFIIAILCLGHVMRILSSENIINMAIFARVLNSSWMPWRWFVALGLIGHSEYAGFSAWEGITAFLITSALIAFGLRAFRADYLIKTSTLIQGNVTSSVRPPRRLGMSLLVRKITRAPSGYGAFSFLCKMFRRDWNFRQQAFPYMAMLLLAGLAVAIKGIRNSPFGSAGFAIENFSLMHLFPHCLGLILAIACAFLSFTSEPKGSSIFITLPLRNLRPFVKGVYLSLWIHIVALPHFFLLGPCIWFWGMVHGMIYVAFSASLASLYLGMAFFFIEGFPFANPFKPSMGTVMNIPILTVMVLAVILVGLQWFLFINPLLVLGAALASTVLALIIAPISLRNLEKKAGKNLELLRLSPQKIFREAEP